MPGSPYQAVSAYSKAAIETATPRQLEAQLLLKAAGRLQRVLDHWTDKPSGLSEAVLYNRRLWIVLIDAVIRDENKLPCLRDGRNLFADDQPQTGAYGQSHRHQSPDRSGP
jgi:flagellar biosynthesis regulator FlaF